MGLSIAVYYGVKISTIEQVLMQRDAGIPYLYDMIPNHENKMHRLQAYSAAAIALMAIKPVEGQVHYTDIDPDVILEMPDEYLLIDLNGDGLSDIKFLATSFYLLMWTFSSEEKPYLFQYINASAYSEAFAYNENSVAFSLSPGVVSGGYWHVAKAINAGETIGAALAFDQWGAPLAEKIHSCTLTSGFGVTSCNYMYAVGQWHPALEQKFIGLHFTTLSDVGYYGWIRCSVSDEGSVLTIHDYAYNMQPEQPIIAGDTNSVDINTMSPTELNVNIDDQIMHVHSTANGEASLQIFDLQGQLVKNVSCMDGNISVDISSLASGAYIARLTQGAFFSSTRFIKN
jgi:hypothetical protein